MNESSGVLDSLRAKIDLGDRIMRQMNSTNNPLAKARHAKELGYNQLDLWQDLSYLLSQFEKRIADIEVSNGK